MEKYILSILIVFLGFPLTIKAQENMGSYNDLSNQILTLGKESDIICIGEHSHSDINALNTKALILSDFADKVPTGAILFEAPLVASILSFLRNESYSEFVWPFWRYESIKITLDSIIDANQLIPLGFDPQETCKFSKFSSFLISEGYLENEVELNKMDSILSFAVDDGSFIKRRNLTKDEAENVKEIIEKIKLKLNWPAGISKTNRALISLCFENRKYLADLLTFNNINVKMNYRDSIMALNLKHINTILKPSLVERKIIIWGANLHVAKKMTGGDWMMERFIKNNSEKVLTLGVIPFKRNRLCKRFDFVILSGQPNNMSAEIFNKYTCD